MPDVPLTDVLGQLDIADIEAAEIADTAVVDAFVIFRYQHPEWESPRMMYVSTKGMGDELKIGIVTSVLDRMRHVCTNNWVDDE